MTHIEDLISALDEWVFDYPLEHGRGWHDNHAEGRYDPALEQSRTAFTTFFALLFERNVSGTALQIGLGRNGGSHFALRLLAERAVTVEIDEQSVQRYRENQEIQEGRDHLVLGDSHDPAVRARVEQLARGSEVLLIDGDDTYEGVHADWESYAPLVRPGGIVAIPDSSQRREDDRDRFGVDLFLQRLDSRVLRPHGIDLVRIGEQLPIHCYLAPEAATTEALISAARTLRLPEADRRPRPQLVDPGLAGLAIWELSGRYVALEASAGPPSIPEAFRGRYPCLLSAPTLGGIRGLVRAWAAASPTLEGARTDLATGEVAAGKAAVAALSARHPDLRAGLAYSINRSPYSLELLLAAATLAVFDGRVREGVFLLERIIELDICASDAMTTLVNTIRHIQGDVDAALAYAREWSATLQRREIEAARFFRHHGGSAPSQNGAVSSVPV